MIEVAGPGSRMPTPDLITEHELPSGRQVRRLEAGREPDGMAYSCDQGQGKLSRLKGN